MKDMELALEVKKLGTELEPLKEAIEWLGNEEFRIEADKGPWVLGVERRKAVATRGRGRGSRNQERIWCEGFVSIGSVSRVLRRACI